MYSGAPDAAIDLLSKIMVFNPYFRPTVDQILEHPFFKSVRQPEFEVNSEQEIVVECEEALKGDELKQRDIILLFKKEIELYSGMHSKQ